MKKILFFLMLTLLCIPWATRAQNDQFTLFPYETGNNANWSCPVWGYNLNYGDCATEFIIPTRYLDFAEGATFTKMRFYIHDFYFPEYAASVEWNVPYRVYLSETETYSFRTVSDTIGRANATLVFSGILNGDKSNRILDVVFDTPYQYHGGNLVVGFWQNGSSSVYAGQGGCAFVTTSVEDTVYWVGYTDYDHYDFSVGTMIPKITFDYYGISCLKPRDLQVYYYTPGSTTAQISWISEASDFEVEVNGVVYNFNDASPNSEHYYDINVVSGTEYTVKVKAHCNAQEESDWSLPLVFITAPQCEVTLELTSSDYYSGWSYDAIDVWDNTNYQSLGTFRNENGGTETYTIPISEGQNISFSFQQTNPTSPSQCSWVIIAPTGDTISQGNLDNLAYGSRSDFAQYTGSCSACYITVELNNPGGTNWDGNAIGVSDNAEFLTSITPDYNEPIRVLSGHVIDFYWMDGLSGSLPTEPYSWTIRDAGGNIIAQGANYNSLQDGEGIYTFIGDCSGQVPSSCDITFDLIDSYGDGWNGNTIEVRDASTGELLATMKNENLDGDYQGANEHNIINLPVDNGRVIKILWVYDENNSCCASECSWVITAPNGYVINAIGGNAASSYPNGYEIATYTVDCGSTPTPTTYCQPAPTSVDGDGIVNVSFGTGNNIVNNSSYPTSSPYYGDYSSQIGAVAAGTTATVDITFNTCYNGQSGQTCYNYGTLIWVDWNNNMVFEDNEIVFADQSTPFEYPADVHTLNATFAISANQATGDYRMRIGAADSYFDEFIEYGQGFHDPCNSEDYVVFHDYTLRVTEAPSCLAPVVTVVNCTSTTANISWTDNNNGTPTYIIKMGNEVLSGSTTPAVSINGTTATLTGLTTEHYYLPGDFTVTANCDGNDFSNAANVPGFYTGYCKPAPTVVDGNGITNVSFGTGNNIVNNSSYPTSAPYYGNYTSQIGAVAVGQTATVDITYNTCYNSQNSQSCYNYGTIIWVDWNNNQTFEDNEIVFAGMSSQEYHPAGEHTLNATFPVSANQTTGDYRMRIGAADSYFDDYINYGSGDHDPCYSGQFAVFHDYTLRVIDVPSCPPVTDLQVIDMDPDAAQITWTHGGNETLWDLYWTTSNVAPTSDTVPTVGRTPNDQPWLAPLTPNTHYYAYVRARCSDENRSQWSPAVEFTTPSPYTITFNAGNGGTATVGSLECGGYLDLSNVSATPTTYCQNDWTFIGWSETPVTETTTAPTLVGNNYYPSGNATLYAVYQQGATYNSEPVCAAPTFTITYLDDNDILVVDTFEVGANINPIADPTREGYTFIGWSPALPATMPDYDFRVIAQWQIDTFTVTATANFNERGIVSGAGRYTYLSQVEMRAEAAQGYLFDNWTDAQGNVVSTAAIFDFEITHDTAFIANFVSIAVATPTIVPEAAGAVYTEPVSVSILCETQDAAIYYTLDGSEPTANSIPYTGPFTLTENVTVKAIAMKATMPNSEVATANYTINIPVYTVSFDAGDGTPTTISTSGNIVNPIDWSNITASPSELCANDWTFVGWSVNPVSETTEVPVLVSNPYVPTGDITLYAVYQKTGESVFDNTVGGQFTIYAKVGNTKYYATETESADKLNSTTTASDATIFTFEQFDGYEDGEFAIKSGNTYIKYSGSSTNLGTSNNPYKWRFSPGTKGTWRIESQTNGRALIFRANNYNTFKGYSTNNVNGTEYYDIEIGGTATYIYNSNPVCVVPTYTITYLDGNDILDVDTFELGATITPIADPTKVGYTFTGWEPALPGTMPDYDFRAIALWQANSYNITINQVTGGTISVAVGNPDNPTTTTNTAADFESWVQLFVETDNGYTFNNFEVTTIDGIPIDISNNGFVMPAEDVIISATFTLNTYTVTATVDPENAGSVTGTGTYNYNTEVTLTATPATGYSFDHWQNMNIMTYAATETVNPLNFTLTEDITYKAFFNQIDYELVYMNGEELYETVTYNYGDTIDPMSAPEKEGYTFIGWTPAEPVTMPAYNDTLYAQWQLNSYTVTANVNPANAGTVTGAGTYNYGSQVEMSAAAADGYLFTNWTNNQDVVVSTNANFDFVIANDTTFTANFTAMGVVATPTFSPVGGTYNDYDNVNVTLECATSGAIIYYTTDGSTPTASSTIYNGPISLTANSTTTIKAIAIKENMTNSDIATATYVVLPTYAITIANNIANGIVRPDVERATEGTTVNLTAIANSGYHFGTWAVTTATGTVEVSANNSFVMPAGDVTVSAIFEPNDHTITYYNVSGEIMTVETFAYGDTITPIADPSVVGYTFIGWQPALPTTMPDYDLTTMAKWQVNSYRININQVPGGIVQTMQIDYSTGDTIVIDSADYASWVQLSVVTNVGCTFNEYVVTDANGNILSSSNNGFIMPASDVTVTPRFTIQNFTITYRDGGDTLAVDTFAYGANIIPIADPTKEGYTFMGWTSELPSTMPAHNLYVGALWQVNSYNVNITQVTGGTITIGYHNETSTTIIYTTTDATVKFGESIYLNAVPDNGYSFNSYVVTNADGSPIATSNNSFVMPANDVNVSAIFDARSYQLTINYLYQNGAEAAPSHTETIEYNSAYSVVSPALTGYTASQDTVMGIMGAENSIVNVIYSLSSYNITVNQVTGGTVTVLVEGAPAGTTSNTTANYNAWVQLSRQSDTGYSFGGFTVTNADGTTIDVQNNVFYMPANDVTVSATFSLNNYTITYQDDNGDVIDVDTFAFGANITPIANPTREGYTFMGWSEVIPTTMPNHNLAVSAQWQINNYNITIDQVTGGTITVMVNNVGSSSTTTDTAVTFRSWIRLIVETNNGYTFNDFVVTNADGTPIEITNNGFEMPANDVTVTADFTANEYTITYMNINNILAVDTFACGTTIIPIDNPTREGYTFISWAPEVPATMPAGNLTVNAQWQVNSYRINIAQVQGGSVQATQVIDYSTGETIVIDSADYQSRVLLSAVANEGYTFSGLVVTDANGTVLSYTNNGFTMPASDVTVTATFTINHYTVTTTINPENAGTISGAGTYNYGTEVTLTATPATGYSFDHWQNMNIMTYSATETANPLTFTLTGDIEYKAFFILNNYTITYKDGNTVLGVDTFAYGATITPMADPTKEGYTFTGWDTELPTTMPANDLNRVAQWQVNSYRINIDQVQGGNVQATNGTIVIDSAAYGSLVHLSIVTNEGCIFNNLVVTDANGTRISVTDNSFYMPASDVTITPSFTIRNYTITYIDRDNVLEVDTFACGSTIIPMADPAREGYTFIGWDPALPTTMPAHNMTVATIWQVNNYNVTVTQVTGGTITIGYNDSTLTTILYSTTGATVNYGAHIYLYAVPDTGYSFNNYVVTNADGSPIAITNNRFIMPANDVNVSASFAVKSYELTINYLYQNGTEAAPSHTDTIEYNSAYSVVSPALTGYTASQDTVMGTMGAGNLVVNVTYSINSYNITVNQVTGGTISLSMEGAPSGITSNTTANYNTMVQLYVIPDNGYSFNEFTVTNADGTPVIITPTNSFTMPANDVTVSANFSVNNYTITYQDGNGNVIDVDTLAFGANITPIANPTREGYTFMGWSHDLPTTMPAYNILVGAQWQINSYNITVNQVEGGTITVRVNNAGANGTTTNTTAEFNSRIQLTVATDNGYTFNNFVVTNADGTPIETPNNGFYMPANDVTVTANISVNNYTITYQDGNGNVIEVDTLAFGANITPIANPTLEGYTFTGWDPAIPATMPAYDLIVYAQWQINSYNITINQVTGGTITVTVAGATAGTTTNTTADFESWIQLSEVTLDGYTFGDFVVTTADGTPIETPNNGFIMPASDVTVTANVSVNNYTITYMNGNIILAQDTVAFGATVTPIANPTKEGYTFTGWDPALPTTMPANDVTVNAQWQINSYNITINQVTGGTIVITIDNSPGIALSTTADYNSWINLDVVTFDGYTFNNFEVTNADGTPIAIPFNGFSMPANDVTITANFSVNNYTITYMDGNSILAQDSVAFGATVTPIANPTKEGYTFTGWDPALPTTMPANDLTVNAQWQINSYDITINQVTGGTITVSFAGESATSAVSTTTDTSANFETWIQLSEVTEDGYTFVDFLVTDEDGEIIETPNNGFIMPASDVTVTATYTVNNYTITYMDGNSILAQDTVAFGATVTPIANPTKEGYTFTGWDPALPTTMPANDLTVDAQWQINSYNITINQVTGGTITVSFAGESATSAVSTTTDTSANFETWIQLSEVTEDGYTFVDFLVTDEDGEIIETPNNGFIMPAIDVTVTAIYTVNNYIITYMDGNSILAQDTVAFGATVTPIANPTKEGYTFTGWDPELPTTMPANDLTVNAQWQINSYNITINQVTGGTITATVAGATAGTTTNTTADYNSWINLDVVTSDGYTFNNFVVTNTDGTTIEIINNGFIMPANDVTVTATFSVNNYTITYMDGNSILAQDTVAFGATVTPIDNPTKEGYTFTGWDPELPTTMPANDLTVNAQWQVNIYRVNIDQNPGGYVMVIVEGSAVGTTIFDSTAYNTQVQLDVVTLDGYTFNGFTVVAADGTPVAITPTNSFTMPANDVTVSGSFSVNNYTITYMDGNIVLDVDTFAFGATVTPIANPTKEGYTFTGWDPALPTTMPANDVTVNAQWQVNSYDITINQVTGGTITVTVTGATAGTTTNTTANFGSWVQMSVNADYGYDFVDFLVISASGDTLLTPNYSFMMPAENVTITAVFTLHNFNITVNVSDDTPWGTVTGSGSFAYGSTDTLTATPMDEHHIFVGWSDFNTENPRVITVTQDSTLTAYFVPEDIDIISNDTLMGGVNVQIPGGGHLTPNTPIVITATPAPHYHFVSWSDGNTDNPRTIYPMQAIGLTAIFAIDQHTITVLSNDGTMGEVDGDGTFDYGSEIQISATAFSGYVFVSWNDGNTENPRTITVEQDSSFTAIFQLEDGIDDVELPDVLIYAHGNQIVVSNAEGYTLEIYDMSGRLIVSESKLTQSVSRFTMSADGVYLVKIGDRLFRKVVVTR